MIEDRASGSGDTYPLCLHSVSTPPRNTTNSGDRAETRRIHVSALSPLGDASKKLFEVLRLGSGEPRSADPRTSNKTLTFDLIPSNIRAPTVEYANTWLRRCDGENLPSSTATACLCWYGMDGAQLCDSSENWLHGLDSDAGELGIELLVA